MKYLILNLFREYGDSTLPSMLEFCKKEPYIGQAKIVMFLKEKGKVISASTAMPKDRITGEHISLPSGSIVTQEYNGFVWRSDLAYHVEKYNLRLPKEFEDYVLSHSS